MTTISTMLSGGEGVGAGARMAGLVHLQGYEINDKIAQVARNNNFDTITADVLTVDPSSLQVPDILHVSTVCTNASVANSDGEEAQLDIDVAKKVAEFIEVMKPKGFTLENVYPYRNFQSFKIICDALRWNGYSFDFWHLNSADYGVPQTRKRLILIARLDGGMNRIEKPTPTHHNPATVDDNQMTLFAPTTKPWVGWYEAIEDLIPFLPESKFAPWQLERLPDEIKGTTLFASGKYDDCIPRSTQDEPSGAITSDMNQIGRRAFILDGKLNETTRITKRNGENRIFTVTTSHNNRDVKAFVLNSKFPESNGKKHYYEDEPFFTVDTLNGGKAFLVGNNANDTSGAKITVEESEPAQAVRTPSGGRVQRAWLSSGRVVKMTPRALARFQSFPEWYRFPDSNSLAVKVIGNAVPPLLYANVVQYVL